MSNDSSWPKSRILSGATTPGQSDPGSNGNEGVFHFPQITKAGTSQWDCLVSYPGYLLGRGHLSAEMQSVYSTAPSQLESFNCVQTND